MERARESEEAKELLLAVEKELVAKARRNSEVYDDIPLFPIEGRLQQIAVAVCSLFCTAGGLFLSMPIVAHMLRDGIASKYPYSYRYFIEPVYLPAHTVLLLPLILVCIGIWFLHTAYRAWRSG